ncbi:MAG: glk [Candidatus Binatus sp.]|nr:glk [Candidatus Binatus sp.]
MAGLILAGDVGGTKTQLGLYRYADGKLQLIREYRYATLQFKSLEDACADFLRGPNGVDVGGETKIGAACFGVPGPVVDGQALATNVPWTMQQSLLTQSLNGVPVRLINDLGAIAYGVLGLQGSDVAVLHHADNPAQHGNIAVLAAGTGLGESAMVWEQSRYHAVASEGGHSDFGPHGEEQIDLLRFLANDFEHVSYERVLSGPGLRNVYRFLRSRDGSPEPAWLTEAMAAGDPAAAISEAALAGRDPVCVRALTMFCNIYGSEAANLALKVLALGGVFLAGGIAPKILAMLTQGTFTDGFFSKGRLNEILKRIEVRVALNPAAGLIGAARCAAEML